MAICMFIAMSVIYRICTVQRTIVYRAIPRVTCVTLRDLLRPVLQVRRRYPKTFSAPLCRKTSLTMMTTKVFMVTSTFSEICQQSERHVRFTEFCYFWNSEFMCKILWFGKLMIQFLFIMDTRDYFQLNCTKIVCKNWNLKIWQRFKNVWSVSRALRNVRYALWELCIIQALDITQSFNIILS